MLAHLPPLPLILDYWDPYDYITADDELGIRLALENRDRVRRIRVMQPALMLQRLIDALRGEFPNLEYLFIERHTFFVPNTNGNATFDIPETFRAPRLRYLMVMGLPLTIPSPLVTTMGNFVALSLNFDIPWAYSPPNPLLLQVLPMPQLGTLGDNYNANTYFPNDDVESQLLRRAVMRRVTPHLRRFGFQGAKAYLETFLPLATVRLLERLQLYSLDRLKTYLILPRRVLVDCAEPVRLKLVRLTFLKDCLRVDTQSHYKDLRTYRFSMGQGGKRLDWQLASVTNFFRTLKAVFSRVEHIILKCDEHLPSASEWNNEADSTRWRDLFSVFDNARALYMDYGLVGQLSQFLQPDSGNEGESPTTDVLPELRELWYSVTDDPELTDEPLFAQFSHARKNAGRPIKVFQTVIPLTPTLLRLGN